MKVKILETARHRNGVAGAPFDVLLFKQVRERSVKVGILFDQLSYCAVLDVSLLATGDISFGSNSWRGDDFEPELRRAVEHDHEVHQDASDIADTPIQQRVNRCDLALRCYSNDEVFSSLIDLLADAMHWSDATGEDFHYALCLAGKHYVAELNEQPIAERRLQ